MEDQESFQDMYPDSLAHCYGCGRLNEHSLGLKSYWEGEDTTIAHYTPLPFQLSMPGYVSGGLIASLIDCHGTGTASAAGYKHEGREVGSEPKLRYVTASLKVDFRKPTPMGEYLTLKGKVEEVKGKKVVVDITVSAGEVECVTGRVVAVKLPEAMNGSKK